MSTTTYPANLPRPQRDGYALTVTPATTTTARERTNDRVRPQGTASRTVVSLTWVLTDAEFPLWKDWWRNGLLNGSLQATICIRNGLSDVPQLVQFLGEPQEERDLSGGWSLTVQAWVVNPPRYTLAELNAL